MSHTQEAIAGKPLSDGSTDFGSQEDTASGGPHLKQPPVSDAGVARWARNGAALFRSWPQRIWALVGLLAIVAIPLSVDNAFIVSLGVTVGIYTIATIGLNVMVGYTGMISLSHSIFMGIGAFTAVGLGGLLEAPLIVWLPGSFIVAGAVAALIAPLNLRLRGVFQIILSLGLIFIGLYAFVNMPLVTGGNAGIAASPSLGLGFVDFGNLEVLGMAYGYDQGLFILVWLLVGISMVLVANMMRTRFGRSMIAVREAETAAQLAGINTGSVKIRSFILAGAFGGLAGGLLLAQLRFVSAEQFGINLGLELLIITVVGGLGATWGPFFGSLVVASIPLLAQQYGAVLPFIKEDPADSGFGIPVAQVGLLVYGVALVLVMVFEPRGLAHMASATGGWVSRLWRPSDRDDDAPASPAAAERHPDAERHYPPLPEPTSEGSGMERQPQQDQP